MRAWLAVGLAVGLVFASDAYGSEAKCRAKTVAQLGEIGGWRAQYDAAVGIGFSETFLTAAGIVHNDETLALVQAYWLPRLSPVFDSLWERTEPEIFAWWSERMTCAELKEAKAQALAGGVPPMVASAMPEYQAWVAQEMPGWVEPFGPDIERIVMEGAPAFVADLRARGYLE